MTALNDAERAAIRRDAQGGTDRALPEQAKPSAVARTSRSPEWLPSRRFIAAVIAIGGMQLLATMDSTVAIVALPKIHDERRVRHGPDPRWSVDRGVVAVRVPGQRAGRPGDDLPGPHHAARDAQGAVEAGRHRGDSRDAGLYRGGLRVHPGPRERVAGADHHRFAGRRRGVPHRIP